MGGALPRGFGGHDGGAADRGVQLTVVEQARRAAEDAARLGYGKLVACLAAQTRDLAEAEDALSEAFALALKTWPQKGLPASPEAWLLTAARRRFLDAARRGRTRREAVPRLEAMIDELAADQAAERPIPDERLRLIFACAHPAIDPAARAPLILQAVLGLDAAAIASAFLMSPAAMSQRLVRAKQKIRDAGVPFAAPDLEAAPERLQAVLDAVYAVFTQGWSDPAGADPRSRGLVDEALFLGRLIAALLPAEPEPLGLLALMFYAHARRAARRDGEGRFVPLDAHAYRRLSGRTDWPAVVELYDGLLAMTGSVVAALNRALALSYAEGPRAGLRALEAVADDPRLIDYQPYWAARADLCERAGDLAEAEHAYLRAIGLESDPAVRSSLQHRLEGLAIAEAVAPQAPRC